MRMCIVENDITLAWTYGQEAKRVEELIYFCAARLAWEAFLAHPSSLVVYRWSSEYFCRRRGTEYISRRLPGGWLEVWGWEWPDTPWSETEPKGCLIDPEGFVYYIERGVISAPPRGETKDWGGALDCRELKIEKREHTPRFR